MKLYDNQKMPHAVTYKDSDELLPTPEKIKKYYNVRYDANISPNLKHPGGWKLYPCTPCIEHVNPHVEKPVIDFRWCIGDTKAGYEDTVSKMSPEKLKNWRYKDPHKIIYDVNIEGYRCPEWNNIDWENSWILFGCSFIFGVGLAQDETLGHFIQKELGEPVVNLGMGATSNEFIEVLMARMLNNFPKPKGIIVLYTCEDRNIIYTKKGMIHNGPWNVPNPHSRPEWIKEDPETGEKYLPCPYTGVNQTQNYITSFEDPYNAETKLYDIHQRINAMTRDCHLFEGSFFMKSAASSYSHDLSRVLYGIPWSKARDNWHPGREIMEEGAKQISNIIINNILDKE